MLGISSIRHFRLLSALALLRLMQQYWNTKELAKCLERVQNKPPKNELEKKQEMKNNNQKGKKRSLETIGSLEVFLSSHCIYFKTW